MYLIDFYFSCAADINSSYYNAPDYLRQNKIKIYKFIELNQFLNCKFL